MCGCRPPENAQKISLGSWIKPLGFDLCHKDLGTVLPRYRPSQDNSSKYPTRKDNKVLTITEKTIASTPQEGTARTPQKRDNKITTKKGTARSPKTETTNSPYQTANPP
jgi:hypothetical protein